MIKRITKALAAAGLVCGFAQAHAVDITVTDTNFTYASGLISGAFSDTFSFDIVGSPVDASFFASSLSIKGFGVIEPFKGTFTAPGGVVFNYDAVATPFGTTTLRSITATDVLPAGHYSLTLFGTAAPNSSYTLQMISTPVPEPETYAMLLAGLGMLGWAARRRAA